MVTAPQVARPMAIPIARDPTPVREECRSRGFQHGRGVCIEGDRTVDRHFAGATRETADGSVAVGKIDAAGTKVFGSGWVVVAAVPDGRLALATRRNRDTPLMEGKRVLPGNDAWKHADHLRYRNRGADYLQSWWAPVNWRAVGERCGKAKEGKLAIRSDGPPAAGGMRSQLSTADRPPSAPAGKRSLGAAAGIAPGRDILERGRAKLPGGGAPGWQSRRCDRWAVTGSNRRPSRCKQAETRFRKTTRNDIRRCPISIMPRMPRQDDDTRCHVLQVRKVRTGSAACRGSPIAS